jgi:uncharacterized protein
MNTIFLDTVGLLALWDASDQWHSMAESAFFNLNRDKVLLTSTSFVLLECANASARRPYRLAVDRLRERMEVNNMLMFPTHADWNQAWADYRQSDAGQPGIVDYVSFTVMRRLGIQQAFTNDRHFKDAGFETLF